MGGRSVRGIRSPIGYARAGGYQNSYAHARSHTAQIRIITDLRRSGLCHTRQLDGGGVLDFVLALTTAQ